MLHNTRPDPGAMQRKRGRHLVISAAAAASVFTCMSVLGVRVWRVPCRFVVKHVTKLSKRNS